MGFGDGHNLSLIPALPHRACGISGELLTSPHLNNGDMETAYVKYGHRVGAY